MSAHAAFAASPRSKTFYRLAPVIMIVLLGLAIRLFDLIEPPLDFHPTRQLRAAIITRGMYYQMSPWLDAQLRQKAMDIAATMEAYEPPIFERLVAQTYQMLGSESLWVARVYSIFFWMIGGVALYFLARRMSGDWGALLSLAFYLILPWGVVASRSFQPDPMMVMWILLAAWALYRWAEDEARSWRWTLLAGLFSGIAILVKVVAFFPIAGMAVALILSQPRLWKTLRNPRVWVTALLMSLIPAAYYLFSIGQRSVDFALFWTVSLAGLLSDRKFYIKWLGLLRGLMDQSILFAAFLGAFLFKDRGRALALGAWAGYFVMGLLFPSQIYSHDYYSLMLVPIVALSLAPFADLIERRLLSQSTAWRVAFIGITLVFCGYYAWVGRSILYASSNYREPSAWQKLGQQLPNDGAVIALTHDYGNRLKYYGWNTVNAFWPSTYDQELVEAAGGGRIADFQTYFKDQTQGMAYFLVTLFSDLEAQPNLKAMLSDHYPIFSQGDGFIIFDLRKPR